MLKGIYHLGFPISELFFFNITRSDQSRGFQITSIPSDDYSKRRRSYRASNSCWNESTLLPMTKFKQS